jgi:hypothetical protein
MLFPHTPSGREPLLYWESAFRATIPEALYRLPIIVEFTNL